MSVGEIVKIHVGLPQKLGVQGAKALADRPWTSAIFKKEVTSPVWLGKTNLEGDGQADTSVHGGPDKALLCYAAKHYVYWQKHLGATCGPGGFGENLTIEGFCESTVCIGDIFQLGEKALVQVSEARMPCWKLGRRWGRLDLPQTAQNQGMLGWYLRVLEEGLIAAKDKYILKERPLPQWTIAAVNHYIYKERDNLRVAEDLAQCPFMSEAGRKIFRKRIENIDHGSDEKRLFGASNKSNA